MRSSLLYKRSGWSFGKEVPTCGGTLWVWRCTDSKLPLVLRWAPCAQFAVDSKVRRGVQTAEESLELFKRIEASSKAVAVLPRSARLVDTSEKHQQDPKGQSDAYAVLARVASQASFDFGWHLVVVGVARSVLRCMCTLVS